MNTRSIFVSPVAMSLLVACAPDPNPPAPGELAGSTKERLTVAAPVGDVVKAVSGNTDFGLELYRQLGAGGDDNLFISPQSITVALAMTYAGSAGTTKAGFENTMEIRLPHGDYHRAMNDLDRQLASRGQNAKGSDGRAFRLNVTNQFFAQKSFLFEAPFLDTLALEYGANVRLLDFVGNADPSRVLINSWVEQKTESRIKDLLAQGSITSDTRAVLVNAIYFNAAWAKQFDVKNTRAGTFTSLEGSTGSVQMMREGLLPARAATVNGVEVVSLPYDGKELSLLVLMPPANFKDFEQKLTDAQLQSYFTALQAESLDLSMPKFEFRTSASLAEPLKRMGLGEGFSDAADFSNMSKSAQLRISDVIHQAFVKVNESGTEASAATAVIVDTRSLPGSRTVTIDKPFVFMVRDDATGAIVFLGRMVKP